MNTSTMVPGTVLVLVSTVSDLVLGSKHMYMYLYTVRTWYSTSTRYSTEYS